MAPSTPSPQFATFFTSIQEAEQVRHDIALLSYLLAKVTWEPNDSGTQQKPFSRPKLDPIQLWIHLAFMLTTGRPRDPSGSKVVAVTGKVENDSITAALVTRNVSHRNPSPQLSISELTPIAKRGWRLLRNDSSTTMCAEARISRMFPMLTCL